MVSSQAEASFCREGRSPQRLVAATSYLSNILPLTLLLSDLVKKFMSLDLSSSNNIDSVVHLFETSYNVTTHVLKSDSVRGEIKASMSVKSIFHANVVPIYTTASKKRFVSSTNV